MALQVLVTGSRKMTREMRLKAIEVVEWCKDQGHELIVGDAIDINNVVRNEAVELCVRTTVYGAYGVIREAYIDSDRAQHIKTPGSYPERDRVMADECDLSVAVWNGKSRGTKITFEAARRLGKRVIVRTFN